MVLGGDFLQTLPVVPRGSRKDIVDSIMQCSRLWEQVEILQLIQNVQLDPANADAHEFSHWLLNIGHGRTTLKNGQIHFLQHMQIDT